MADADFDPAKLANPASGFRFPPRTSFGADLATTELRLVILGWLRQAEQVINTNGGVQELRDAVFRASELTIAVSARVLAQLKAEHDAEQRRARASRATGTNGHERSHRRKAAQKAVPRTKISEKETARSA